MSAQGDSIYFEALRNLAAHLAEFLGEPADAIDGLVENALNTAEEKIGPDTEQSLIPYGLDTQIFLKEDGREKERVMRYYSAFKQ